MGKAFVRRFRMGPVEIEVEGGEGKSLLEVATDLGMSHDGSAWSLNGTRLSAEEVKTARVRPGDTLKHAPKGDQGV